MKNADQCHSTHGPKAKTSLPSREELHATKRSLPVSAGRVMWRSEDELADTAEFRDWLEREFPSGMAELVTRESVDLDAELAAEAAGERTGKHGESRREFLKLMGASMALAGAATIPGCRRPDHKIMPYSREVPEEIVPGRPLFYATAFPRPDGGAEGLLVETHEGRPTKIEGNPLHPMNHGKSSIWAQASIMEMYDPDRLKHPKYLNPARKAAGEGDPRLAASWDDFVAWGQDHLSQYDAKQGDGLAFVVRKKNSPTRDNVKKQLLARFPKAKWVAYEAADAPAFAAGTKIAFGKAMWDLLSFSPEGSKVIVSLDRDFLNRSPDEVVNARTFAATRRVEKPEDGMSRLYVVESAFTATGSVADHRLRLSPSRIAAFAVALAKEVMPRAKQPGAEAIESALASMSAEGEDIPKAWVEEVAKDLLDSANREKTLILAGASQPAEVHALVHAMNAALGNIGKTVTYREMGEDEKNDAIADLAALVGEMKAGKISTLICVETNPVYDAPGDLDFAGAMKKVGSTITLSVGETETASASTWSLNAAHYLESWGDVVSIDGTVSPIQPMIAPLYDPVDKAEATASGTGWGPLSDIEFLALCAAKPGSLRGRISGYDLVRETWKKRTWGAGGFEAGWKRALHDGLIVGSAPKGEAPKVDFGAVAASLRNLKIEGAPTTNSLDVVFVPGQTFDGRYAGIAWLHELPEMGSRVAWDNPAYVSPRTAKALNLEPVAYKEGDPNAIYTDEKYPMGRKAELSIGGRKVEVAVWIMPGMPDDTVVLTFGYGRETCGRVGDGVGFNVYGVRSSDAKSARVLRGGRFGAATGTHMIASTQIHWSLEGRTTVFRAVDLPAWKKHGNVIEKRVDAIYATEQTLNFAEKLGELSHTPPNISIYTNPYNKSQTDAAPGSAFSVGPQWGMTIDLSTCTGCGTCTIACQAENNIPVVGKKEVAKGREMHWIRVDRYYVGDVTNGTLPTADDADAMYHQPVCCVHCENAPCETVCPVNATVHGPEGINYMTYNRCIGTRYCANNCPYKVRRYNFFEYGKHPVNGEYLGQSVIDPIASKVPGQGKSVTGSDRYNKINVNLIPPRLRKKLAEIERMQKNPDVSVRMRGVMEKCSFCIQRINAARIECKLHDIKDAAGRMVIPDGFFQTACQQACPSDAIVFGDILDTKSQVHKWRHSGRNYAVLGYLNTRPRVTHLVKVSNPNVSLLRRLGKTQRVEHIDEPFHHGGGGHGNDHGGGHGETPKAGEGKKGHAYRFDRRKRGEDRGYALSLNVLGSNNGGVA